MSGLPLRADRAGSTSLEFAMSALTAIVLLLGAFDLGLLFLAQRSLDDGVNRAARWAAVNSGTASVATVLAQFKLAAIPALPDAAGCVGVGGGVAVAAGSCGVVVSFPSGTAVGGLVTVQASFPWAPVSPVDGFLSTTLHSTVSLSIQH